MYTYATGMPRTCQAQCHRNFRQHCLLEALEVEELLLVKSTDNTASAPSTPCRAGFASPAATTPGPAASLAVVAVVGVAAPDSALMSSGSGSHAGEDINAESGA